MVVRPRNHSSFVFFCLVASHNQVERLGGEGLDPDEAISRERVNLDRGGFR